MSEDLEIYRNYMDLIAYTNDLVRKYPKNERFALVEEIKSTLYKGLRHLMYAIKLYHKQEKMKNLNELDIELRLLKIHIMIKILEREYQLEILHHSIMQIFILMNCNSYKLQNKIINSCDFIYK